MPVSQLVDLLLRDAGASTACPASLCRAFGIRVAVVEPAVVAGRDCALARIDGQDVALVSQDAEYRRTLARLVVGWWLLRAGVPRAQIRAVGPTIVDELLSRLTAPLSAVRRVG